MDKRLTAIVGTIDIAVAAVLAAFLIPEHQLLATIGIGYAINLIDQHTSFLPTSIDQLSSTLSTLKNTIQAIFQRSS